MMTNTRNTKLCTRFIGLYYNDHWPSSVVIGRKAPQSFAENVLYQPACLVKGIKRWQQFVGASRPLHPS